MGKLGYNGNGHIDQHEFDVHGKPHSDVTLLGSGHHPNPGSGQNYEPTQEEEICEHSDFGYSPGVT